MGFAFVTKVVAANGDPSLKLVTLERGEILHEGGIRFSSCFDVERVLVDSSKGEVEMCVSILVDWVLLSVSQEVYKSQVFDMNILCEGDMRLQALSRTFDAR
jgi:hypothetical protein